MLCSIRAVTLSLFLQAPSLKTEILAGLAGEADRLLVSNYLGPRFDEPPKVPKALGDVLARGAAVVPGLAELVTDQTPIGLHVPSWTWGAVFDTPILDEGRNSKLVPEDVFENARELGGIEYRLGDLAFRLLGDIVNRDYLTQRGGRGRCYGTLASRHPVLAQKVKDAWIGCTSKSLLKSLEKDLLDPYIPDRDEEAAVKLARCYPKEAPELIARKLRDAFRHKDPNYLWDREQATSGTNPASPQDESFIRPVQSFESPELDRLAFEVLERSVRPKNHLAFTLTADAYRRCIVRRYRVGECKAMLPELMVVPMFKHLVRDLLDTAELVGGWKLEGHLANITPLSHGA